MAHMLTSNSMLSDGFRCLNTTPFDNSCNFGTTYCSASYLELPRLSLSLLRSTSGCLSPTTQPHKMESVKKAAAKAEEVRETIDLAQNILKETGSFISDKVSDASSFLLEFVDKSTGKKFYNECREPWDDLPALSVETMFKRIEQVSKYKTTFSPERVCYQAQLHLYLYGSLAKTGSTARFEDVYKYVSGTEYWQYIDNSKVETIGEYLLFELCVDCGMIMYMLPHLPKSRSPKNPTETEVDTNSVLIKAFELIYFRLLRHLCALIEGFIELNGIAARAMMSRKTAAFLATRSLNRQANTGSGKSAGNRYPRLGSPPDRDTKPDPLVFLESPLATAEGDHTEVHDYVQIRRLHRDRMDKWHGYAGTYQDEGFVLENGLSKEWTVLLYLIDPAVFSDTVYERVHKRAYRAVLLTKDIVGKVCERLYVSQEQKDEVPEFKNKASSREIFDAWKAQLRNVPLEFDKEKDM